MEGRRDRRYRLLLFLLLLSFTVFASIDHSLGDLEPNDSLDDPEELIPGSVSGNVTSIYHLVNGTYVGEVDKDIYSIIVPGRSNLTVELKKTDDNGDRIRVDSYDQDNMEQYMIYGSVYIQGEVSRDVFTNEDENETVVKLVIMGNGSYKMKVKIDEVSKDFWKKYEEPPEEEKEQGHYSYETASRITPGVYNGSVDDSSYSFQSDEYYRITVPKQKKLRISLEKTDNNEGAIYLNTYLGGEYFMDSDDIMLDVSLERRVDSGYWKNFEGDDKLVIFNVEGRGSYTIEVKIEDADSLDSETVLKLVLVVVVVLVLTAAIPILSIIILFVIVLKVVSYPGKKKKKRKKGKT